MSTLRQRFRTVVAMWIFVGLLGGPFAILMGVAAFTAVGPFQPKAVVDVGPDAGFPPGEELKVRGKDAVDLRAGDFLVLASPADVDPAAVTCTWKSRVYTTGEQRSDVMEPRALDGVEPVVRDGRTGERYRVVRTTASPSGVSWMGIDFVTCDGEGVAAFAVVADESTSTRDRMVAGVVSVLFGLVATALGFGALVLTRHWSRTPPPPPPGAGYGGPYRPGPYPPHLGQAARHRPPTARSGDPLDPYRPPPEPPRG